MNRKQEERMAVIREAIAIEHAGLNAAIRAGKIIILPTGFGPYEVECVHGFDAVTHPVGTRSSWLAQRTFALCNDGTWADLLEQAGVPRHPLFAKLYTRTHPLGWQY